MDAGWVGGRGAASGRHRSRDVESDRRREHADHAVDTDIHSFPDIDANVDIHADVDTDADVNADTHNRHDNDATSADDNADSHPDGGTVGRLRCIRVGDPERRR
ncbi:hypothetical protein [Haloarcula laminariae]|uniref:hypothetical protein n=1 Tax=Haloarcula laminariae TaxID=2961577 RepID=UPI0021C73B5D|nr:hypothetical protein [Halomicroarcula laminariae]